MWSYLSGEIDYDEMVYRGSALPAISEATNHWLKGWHDVHWLDSEDFEQSLNTVFRVVSA